jgi:hypothetical protein
MTDVAARLAAVQSRIEAAVRARGPGPAVRLVGVAKKQGVDAVRAAAAAGLVDVGENYAQELRDKRRALEGTDLRWHFIGPVQSNKVKYVVGCALVHTVDRLALLDALEARATRDGVDQDVLVQVNIAGEVTKHGAAPGDVPTLLDRFTACTRARCRGLMVIPPPGEARPHFAALRRLRDELAARPRKHVDLAELSMGMSADYETAIAEGATLVRVGTAIFGPRTG